MYSNAYHPNGGSLLNGSHPNGVQSNGNQPNEEQSGMLSTWPQPVNMRRHSISNQSDSTGDRPPNIEPIATDSNHTSNSRSNDEPFPWGRPPSTISSLNSSIERNGYYFNSNFVPPLDWYGYEEDRNIGSEQAFTLRDLWCEDGQNFTKEGFEFVGTRLAEVIHDLLEDRPDDTNNTVNGTNGDAHS